MHIDLAVIASQWSKLAVHDNVQGWACGLCVDRERKIASIEEELKVLKAKVAA